MFYCMLNVVYKVQKTVTNLRERRQLWFSVRISVIIILRGGFRHLVWDVLWAEEGESYLQSQSERSRQLVFLRCFQFIFFLSVILVPFQEVSLLWARVLCASSHKGAQGVHLLEALESSFYCTAAVDFTVTRFMLQKQKVLVVVY